MKLNRKWIMVLALVMSMAMATTGTLAYLTDRDSEANVFTMGNVEIDLEEEFVQGSELIPGVKIEKEPTITNTGKNEAWVWATVAVPADLEDALDIGWPAVDDANWTKLEKVEQVDKDEVTYNVYTYLYKTALAKGDATTPIITSVTMKPEVDIDPDGKLNLVVKGEAEELDWNINDDGNPIIYVSAYAIQKEGFATVEEAYAAYNAQWTTDSGVNNGLEFAEIPTIFSWEGVKYVTSGETGEAYANGGDTIYRGIFSDGKTTASEIIIHEGIVRLNDRALCKAPTITSVSLPSTLTYVDESAFQQSNITEIEIPENVTYIGKTAFGSCAELEKIVIKAKDVTLANYVGRDCPALKEVYIYSDSVTFESGSMYFTNAQTGDASNITFYVSNQEVADALFNASSASKSYGLLIKSIDGKTEYHKTLK